jgi:polyisoprenoid-binding protein YceI
MKRFSLCILLLCTCLMPLAAAQEPDSTADSVTVRWAKFVFDDPTGRNTVMFSSEAPLETIIGVTSDLYGYVDFNLDSLLDNPKAHFECDLTNLKTGISLRDEKMRSEEYLAADSFPVATFDLLSVKKTSDMTILNETVANIVGRGQFSLRGMVDTINVTLTATYFQENEITETRLPGDILKFKADFDIRMSRFGITIPEEVILKLDDRIHVHIDAFGGTGVEPIDRSVATEAPVDESAGEVDAKE